MTIATAVLADTPTLYWKLDDPTGPAAGDSSGNGNAGFYLGTVNLAQPGPEAGTDAALFGPAGGVRTLAGSPRRALPFSFDCWFASEAQQGDGNVIVYNGLSSADGLGECWGPASTAGNALKLLRGGIAFGGNVGNVTVGAWHHFALTMSAGSNLNNYLDGTNIGAVAGLAFNAIGVNSPFVAGAAAFASQLVYMAHVALYPAELTAARVAAHAASPVSPQNPALVGQPTQGDLADVLAQLALIYAAVHKVFPST